MRSARVTPNTVGYPSDYNALVGDAAGGANLLAHQMFGTIALPTNPTNGQTLTFDINGSNVVITFVSVIGSTAGNVLIGASASATMTNLVQLLLNPTITNTMQVAIGANTSVNVTLINYINWSASGTNLVASSYNTALYSAASSFSASTTVTSGSYTANTMALYVEPGVVYVSGTRVIFSGGSTPTVTAPSSHPRIDVLTMDNSGTLAWTTGTESSSPSAPTYPANKAPLCELYNVVGETALYDNANQTSGQGYISNDVRAFLQPSMNWTAFSSDLIPDGDGTRNLGSTGNEWNNLYVKSGIFLNGASISAQMLLATTAAESITAGAALAAGYYQSDGGIEIDTAGGSTPTGSSGSYSQPITVGTGHSNTMLLVLIRYRANSGTITSVPQWNGVNMTNLSLTDAGSSNGHVYGAYILNPATGTKNLTWTATGNGSDVACVSWFSLYNVAQTGTIDNSAYFGNSSSGTPTVTMTPNSIGAFVIAYAASNAYTGAALTWENNQNLTGTAITSYTGDANKAFPLNAITVGGAGSSGGLCGLISIAPYTAATLEVVVNASASNTAATYPDNFSGYRSSAFIGFAVSSASPATSLNIILAGVVSGLSGLIAPLQYYLSNTGGAIATIAGSITRKVGIAISTTQLIATNIW